MKLNVWLFFISWNRNDDGVSKRPSNSRSRGLRELKGLISFVYYDGVTSRSRSRASSTVVGVVGSFK